MGGCERGHDVTFIDQFMRMLRDDSGDSGSKLVDQEVSAEYELAASRWLAKTQELGEMINRAMARKD